MTAFLYDGLNVVQELNGSTPTANLLTGLGIDAILQRTESGVPSSSLADGLGSSLVLTDSARIVQSEYTYEPFGKTTATGVASTNVEIGDVAALVALYTAHAECGLKIER